LRKSAFELFRSLLERKIVVVMREGAQTNVRVNTELQIDFSLNQSLALYLLDTLKLLDSSTETYALDALSLVESILESPELILRKQLDRIKTIKMGEMKAAGIEFDERIEELEKLEYPKPNRDFIYDTFNVFRDSHPWVGQENIRPKSIAREMFENFNSFAEYIRDYDLQRIEGLLLRYLSEVYKVLVQTVPEAAKTEELRAVTVYFGSMVRSVDSSLLEDWEKMRSASPDEGGKSATVTSPTETKAIDHKALTLLIRNQVYGFVRALASQDFEAAIALLQAADSVSEAILEERMSAYRVDHSELRTDPGARSPRYTVIAFAGDRASVEQILVDDEGHNDWMVKLSVDLIALQQNTIALSFESLSEVGSE
jgi:hypothetical protein